MRLRELFDNNTVQWNWDYNSSTEAEATFVVGNIQYRFYAFAGRDNPGRWEVEFKIVEGGDPTNRFGITGTGNAATVMSTVVAILTAFLKMHDGKVSQLVFSAKEHSRRDLYSRMVRRLLPSWNFQKSAADFTLTAPAPSSEETIVTELFDPKTSFPLTWEVAAAGTEAHAEAHDADGRTIDISFTPSGPTEQVIEVVFSRGGSYDMTGKGDASRVLATVLNAINIYVTKYRPLYIAFSAKSTGGRASAYAAMVKRAAQGYRLLEPGKYPAVVNDFLEFLGSDQPFVLERQ
tara:strand:+ start:11897 stop:12769 length:873 start_codon:yes stop_codon:yes gene_type:complete